MPDGLKHLYENVTMSENLFPARDAASHRGPTPDDLRLVLVRLQSWPDLGGVPEYKQAHVARVCALLSRKPTAGHLIPRVLGQDEGEVMDVVLELLRAGHVSVASAAVSGLAPDGPPSSPAPLAIQTDAPAPSPFQPPRRSLIAKLWSKLVS